MIKGYEMELAKKCISFATEAGADAARVSLGKCVTDAYTLLNGQLDKATHSADRSVYIYLFVDGRYGTFSTNRLEEKELQDFICKAVEMARMLGEDKARMLPALERTAKDALTGNELGLFDEAYRSFDSDKALTDAYRMSSYEKLVQETDRPYRIISEECEFSCTADDNYTVDSQGFEGRHTETCYSVFAEMTIQDKEGSKHSGFWWESSFNKDGIELKGCAQRALDRAVRQIGPKKRRGGHYKMVVDTSVATKLIAPVITALNAASIQQKMSFLEGSKGKKVFSEGLTIMDNARTPGKAGSRLYDSEGVATKDTAVIEKGVVKQYFVSTYMAEKTGFEPTIEDISRPCVMPFVEGNKLTDLEKGVSLKDILQFFVRCSNGVPYGAAMFQDRD